jgi:hypothetical protein
MFCKAVTISDEVEQISFELVESDCGEEAVCQLSARKLYEKGTPVTLSMTREDALDLAATLIEWFEVDEAAKELRE